MKPQYIGNKISLLLFSIFLLCGPNIFGYEKSLSLFLEPIFTYELGETSVNYPPPLNNSSGSVTGFGLGAKIGFSFYDTFLLGLDSRFSLPQFKDSSVTYNSKSISINSGPFIGMYLPNHEIRLWGTLILGGELNPDISGNFDVTFKNPTGYRIGTGFKLSVISINLEYQILKFSQTALEQIGPFSTNSEFDSVNLDNNSWIVSVSFPIDPK